MKTLRKEIPVKNKPGINKLFYWCEASSTWKPTGKFRAVKRVLVGGVSRREQAVFNNLEDAVAFRREGSEDNGKSEHLDFPEPEVCELTFSGLVEQWKKDHFLLIEESTKQTYEKLLPTLDFLNDYPVHKIDGRVLSKLAHFWAKDYPRSWRRKSFRKEWQLLRVILQFYVDEIPEGINYNIPSFKKFKKMTYLVPNVEGEVEYLDADEAVNFLEALKARHKEFYFVALLLYFFALRVGEVCGLFKDCLDLEKGVVTIRRNVHWDLRTWIPRIKEYTKTKQVRYLPIPEQMVDELRDLLNSSDPETPLLLSRDDGSPLNRKTIATFFNKVLVELGYTHVSGTHFLRPGSAE